MFLFSCCCNLESKWQSRWTEKLEKSSRARTLSTPGSCVCPVNSRLDCEAYCEASSFSHFGYSTVDNFCTSQHIVFIETLGMIMINNVTWWPSFMCCLFEIDVNELYVSNVSVLCKFPRAKPSRHGQHSSLSTKAEIEWKIRRQNNLQNIEKIFGVWHVSNYLIYTFNSRCRYLDWCKFRYG